MSEHAPRWREWLGGATVSAELARLSQTLALRVGRYLEHQVALERDAQNSRLAGDEP